MVNSNGQTIWIADAHRGDGRRFIVHADEKLSAFVELERQALTVTFYLESHSTPDLVKRDHDGKLQTVRYEAVNAMLLNEFLKEHKAFE